MRPAERAEREGPRAVTSGLCCPYCSGPLQPRGRGLLCPGEGRLFASNDGIYRLLEETRRIALRPMIEMEHRLRRDDGLASRASRGRTRRLLEACEKAASVLPPGPWRVLEVGAGSAWAGAVLAARGHEVTAIDVSLDADDGLRAADEFLGPGVSLVRVEADMEALPFEPGLFDLVLAVDALHHAREVQRTLVELRRVTRREGVVLVMESPVFARREDGEAEVARRMRRLRRRYDLALPRELQPGYLVRGELDNLFGQAGYRLERPAAHELRGLRMVLADLGAVLLGRGGLPTRPLILARRDG
jgi:SAM-dependent methyltransferase